MSELVLDTKAGLRKGGARGAEVVPGNPSQSRLLQALRYTDPTLQMPPTGKLPDQVIADFEQWIAAGAPDPRVDPVTASASPAPLKGMSIELGRKWWAFQPVREIAAPKVKNATWPRAKIDSFLLAALENKGLETSPRADPRTLIQRVYIDLTGLRPTYEEVDAFAKDSGPEAYERLIGRLLASSHYGEAWGRHWLDVARYGEDNPTSDATNPPYVYAWRYRDWVIKAINDDMPYDRFVKLQLSADLMPGVKRDDFRALGYLGAAPAYHKEPRLSAEVLDGISTDEWDERVDALGRGLLGITVACARCHDHKFDPITQKDYYSLAGVFASTTRAERPLLDIDSKTETRFLWVEQRLFDLSVLSSVLSDKNPTNPEWAARRLVGVKAEVQQLLAEMEALKNRYPALAEHAERMVEKRRFLVSQDPFMNSVYDAALYVNGADPFLTEMDYRPGQARDLPVLFHGNVASPGGPAPRGFLTVLSQGSDNVFRTGSGRLELGEKIFTDAAPLTARVIVNRVWGWHFGQPLVGTPSDFGTQGEKPSNSELLDDLAARFISHGRSLKWLHREIMFSAAYQQSSRPRSDGEKADQANTLLWRMNPRRLDIEAYRDSILQAAGTLNEALYGPSIDLDTSGANRRTVYGRVSRRQLNMMLKLYDFPDAMQTSPGRDLTTTSLQQLFVMNSSFLQEQAVALAKIVEKEPDDSARIRGLYRRILARDPNLKEIDLGLSYLAHATLAQFAQALLSTNEVIAWR